MNTYKDYSPILIRIQFKTNQLQRPDKARYTILDEEPLKLMNSLNLI